MLKARTLTNLYNARPQWLADAHANLDTAVATAYGWLAEAGEEEALRALNTAEHRGLTQELTWIGWTGFLSVAG